MTEIPTETWQLGIGSVRELGVIREALRENPIVTDCERKGTVIDNSIWLKDRTAVGHLRFLQEVRSGVLGVAM